MEFCALQGLYSAVGEAETSNLWIARLDREGNASSGATTSHCRTRASPMRALRAVRGLAMANNRLPWVLASSGHSKARSRCRDCSRDAPCRARRELIDGRHIDGVLPLLRALDVSVFSASRAEEIAFEPFPVRAPPASAFGGKCSPFFLIAAGRQHLCWTQVGQSSGRLSGWKMSDGKVPRNWASIGSRFIVAFSGCDAECVGA